MKVGGAKIRNLEKGPESMYFFKFVLFCFLRFIFQYVCISVSGYLYVGVGSAGVGVTDVVSSLMWVLGNELRASTRAVCVPNH